MRSRLKPVDFEDCVRLLTALAAACLMSWHLRQAGWPAVSWIPAALLTFIGVAAAWIIVWYLRRKLTYRATARRTKANLRQGGDGSAH